MSEDQRIPFSRPNVLTADAILGNKFPILDDGFVYLVDYMGGDDAIVQAARVCYGTGTRKTSSDRGLIGFLMRHRHTTPFEMVQLKFHVRVPMDLWRQAIRHRTASVNEYSTRWSEAIDSAAATAPDGWRLQSTKRKQGSGEYLPPEIGENLTGRENTFLRAARQQYEHRLEVGVAREQARKDLPLSTYTEAYWRFDLHNLFHFFGLRLDSHAQLEIRQLAGCMFEIAKCVAPVACEAFEKYVLNSVRFTRDELRLYRLISQRLVIPDPDLVEEEFGLSQRELDEFKEKIKGLK